MQEKRTQSGLGRRHEENKEVGVPVKEETTPSHDAKAARATWRKYAIHVLISKSNSLSLIPSVKLDLLPWVSENFRARFPVKVKLAARKIKTAGT